MPFLNLCDPGTAAANTIIGDAVNDPYVRLAALWRHDGAIAALSRQSRASLIKEASDTVTRGNA
jgi:hypothetical protein